MPTIQPPPALRVPPLPKLPPAQRHEDRPQSLQTQRRLRYDSRRLSGAHPWLIDDVFWQIELDMGACALRSRFVLGTPQNERIHAPEWLNFHIDAGRISACSFDCAVSPDAL